MWIKKLTLQDFRSYLSLQLTLDKGINFFVGENGVGKTNILEAISLLSMGKSFVTSDEKHCIAEGKEFAKVKAIYEKDKEKEIQIILTKEGKKVELNQKEIHRLSNMIGNVITISFSPKDVRFFMDAPLERRKFIDTSLSMMEPYYLTILSQYKELLKNRNALLKENGNATLLDVIEDQMIPLQREIIIKRKTFLKDLESEINELYRFFGEKEIRLQYKSDFLEKDDSLNDDSLMKKRYLDTREQDLLRGSTQIGIHKDDVRLLMGSDIAFIGSRGQNRMASLLLKIALASWMKKKNIHPILLLDDVLSELDASRITKLSELLKDQEQVLITGTEVPDPFKKEAIYEIVNHEVTRRN